MPNNVDEKVVQLTFDNKQFEKGVAQSVKSLEDLKKALELDKMSDSLHTLEQTTSSMSDNFGILQRSVDQVSKAFTPLGRIVYKAMDDMATAIESKVKSFAKLATGMESLQAGQQKYEKYTKSVQVITNATGKSVDEVSKHLDKLLKYTDETSYDFSEMVSSIGKFTSVGIDLERAEAAMEGIANWAAKSGAGKAEANRAMYNISQAMGAGYMKLIDWKSIENANMATKEFKEVAIQTAEELGVINKNSGITYQNFNETLRHGWLTADVMTEVLARYADTSTDFGLAAFHAAQEALTFTDAIDALKDAMSSGWMKTQEYLFGNLDEARVMWTNVANALIEFSDIFTSARNNILQSWHELGGYTAAVEAVSNAWQAFMNVAYAIRDVIASMFPPDFDEQLVAMTEHVRDITAGWKEMLGIDTYTEVSEEIDVMVNKAEQFTDTLKRGARSEGVRALQEQLVKAGYLTDKSGADGIYGPHTQEAIKKLQRDLGVKVTGAWDDATKAAAIAQKSFIDTEKKEQKSTLKNVEEVIELEKREIDHAEKLNKVLKRGARGDAVKQLQEELIRLGYLTDKSGADGIYGPKTEEAVKKLQKAIGTDITGAWDETTMASAKSKKAMVEVIEEEKTVYKETSGVTRQVLTLQDIVKGIASTIKTVLNIVGAGIKIVLNVLKIFQPLVTVGFRVIAMFLDMFTTMNKGIEAGDGITKVSNAIIKVLSPLAYVIAFVANCINDLINGYASFLNITGKKNSFVSFFEYLAKVFAGNWIVDGFISIFTSVKDIVVTTVGFIISVLGSLFGSDIDEATGEPKQSGIVTFFQTVLSLVGMAVQGIAALVNWFVNTIKTLFATISKCLGPAKDGIGGFFSSISSDVKNGKIKTFNDFFTSLNNALGKFTPIVDKIKSAKDTFISTFHEMFDAINGESDDANDNNAITSLFKTVKAFLFTVAKFDFTKYLLPAIGALATYGFFKSAFSLESFSDVIGMIFSNNGLKNGGMNKISLKLLGAISTIALAVGLLTMLDINKVGEFFKSFNDWFKQTKLGVKFNEITGSIKKWYDNTKGYFQNKFPVVFDFFKDKWESIKEFMKFDSDLTFFENIKNKFEEVKAAISTIISNIKIKLNEFKEYFLSLFTVGENGRLKLFDELANLVSKFDFVVQFFIGVKDRFVKAVQEIFGAADGEDPNKSGKGVFDLFGMIGKFLSKIGSINIGKMLNTAIVGLLAYGWFQGSKALKNFSEGFEFFISKGAIKKDNIGDTALKIAGAIGVVALALALLSAINLVKALGGLALMAALVGGFVGLTKLFSKIDDDAAKNMGTQILAMASSIAVLAIGFQLLMWVVGNIAKNPGQAVGAFVILAAMLAGLTFIEIQIKKAKGTDAKISNVLDMCKGVVYLVVAFAGLIEIVKHNWSGQGALQMLSAFAILSALLWELFGIEYLLSRGSDHKNVSVNGVLSMCVGVEVLVLALSSLVSLVKSNWNKEGAGPLIAATVGIAGMIAGLYWLIKAANGNNGEGEEAKDSSKNIKWLAVFMLAFAYSMKIIADGLAEALSLTKNVPLANMITFMAAMVVFVGEYIGMLKVIEGMGSEKMDIAKLAVGIAGFAAFAWAMQYMAKGLAEAVNSMSDADPWTIITFLGGMSVMLIALGAFIRIATPAIQTLGALDLKTLLVGLGAVILLGLEAAVLSAVFAAIRIAAIESLGEALWLLGQDISSFANQIGSITWSEFKTNADLAIEGIDALVTGLVDQAANVVSAQTITAQLKDVGADLQLLNTSLSAISGDTGADMTAVQDFVNNIKTMVDTLNTITIADSVTSAITELGSALNLYYKMIQGIGIDEETGEEFDLNFTKVDSQMISDAFSAIKDSVKEEDIKTIQSYAEGGDNDMIKAATGINAIAEAIKSYGSIADNLDEGKVKTANGIIELFASIPEKLKMGDSAFEQLFNTFDGTNESKISGFASDMVLVGGAISQYITAVEGINEGKITLANSTIDFLADLNAKLPQNDGGFLGKLLFGGSALDTFSNSMSHLGGGIKEYCDKIKEADFSKVSDSLVAVDTLADISGKLEKSGGLNALIEGDKDFGTLGSGLGKLGENLMSFATTTNTFEYSQVEKQIEAINNLVTVFGNMHGLFIQKDGLTLNKMDQFGVGLKNMFENVASIYKETITIKEHGFFKDGTFASDETMPVLEAVAGLGEALMSALSESIKASATGTEEGTGSLQSALSQAVINAAEAVKAEQVYYVETGRYLAEGLIEGFKEKYSVIIDLMTKLGLDVPEELRTVTKVQSPSKVFAEIGKYWMDGLRDGISNASPDLFKTTDFVSNKVVEAFAFNPVTKDDPFGYLKGYYKDLGHAFEDESKAIAKFPINDEKSLYPLPENYENPFVKAAEENQEAAEKTQEAVKDTEEVVRSAVEETIDLMAKFDKNLKRGSKGDDVKQLQTYLSTLGFMPKDAKIDGRYGKITEKAVRDYQKQIGAIQSGIWDDETIGKSQEYNYRVRSGLDKLSNSEVIKRSDVERIVKNVENYEAIASAIESNSYATARVIGRTMFDTRDYGLSKEALAGKEVSELQDQIEKIDKEISEVYLETTEGKHSSKYFDETAKYKLRDRLLLQMKQFEGYAEKGSDKFSSDQEYWAYMNKEFGRFLYDIGYKDNNNASQLMKPRSRHYLMDIVDYIDKNGGAEKLLDLNKDRNRGVKANSIYKSGWAQDPFSSWFNSDPYASGYEDVESYFSGASDALQNGSIPDLTNPQGMLSELGLDGLTDTLNTEGIAAMKNGDFSPIVDSFIGKLDEGFVEKLGGTDVTSDLFSSLFSSFSSGDTNGMMGLLKQLVPSLDFNTMGVKEITDMVSSSLTESGTSDNIKQGIINGIISTLYQSGTGNQNIRPVFDNTTGAGLESLQTTGIAITSPVSLDEATKITLSTIEEKVNSLGEKFDSTAEKLNQLANYVQEGFNMVKNKDTNVYIDGQSLANKIYGPISRLIGQDTARSIRSR